MDSQTQWLSQLASMRQAIADLNLPKPAEPFLDNLDIDEAYSSPATVDDIWDIISSDDETTDDFDDINGVPLSPTAAYDQTWLEEKCTDLSIRKPGIDPTELAQHILAALAADSADDELQMALVEIVGFDDLDLVIELIAHRAEILSQKPSAVEAQTDGLAAGRLLTKAEREHALRVQDYEHKHAALLPAQSRSEPIYPHVFKSHDSRNTLALGGKKYGLPLGSQQVDEQRYTEFEIPA